MIAECSELEFERLRRERPSLLGLFRIVRIDPVPANQMPPLLAEYQRRVDGSRALTDRATRQLVQLLDFFSRDVSFPGKGFRFLDWLVQEGGPRPTVTPEQDPEELSADEVSAAFARFSGLPLELISDGQSAGPDVIAGRLRAGVIGQDNACLTAARVLTRFKTGLTDRSGPSVACSSSAQPGLVRPSWPNNSRATCLAMQTGWCAST